MSNDWKSETPELEAAVTRALEAQPSAVVPADFAQRVMQALPPQPAARRVWNVGQLSAIVGGAVLTIALFALAPHARPSLGSFAFDMELVMLLELCGVAYWFGAREMGNS